jgi:hypothetical protein
MTISFTVGDRVRTRTSSSVPEGTLGSIHEILRNVRDMYYVQFDGHDRPTLMHAGDLEPVEDDSAAERAERTV